MLGWVSEFVGIPRKQTMLFVGGTFWPGVNAERGMS